MSDFISSLPRIGHVRLPSGILLPFRYPSSMQVQSTFRSLTRLQAGPGLQITKMVWNPSGILPAGRVPGPASVLRLLRGLLPSLLMGLLTGLLTVA